MTPAATSSFSTRSANAKRSGNPSTTVVGTKSMPPVCLRPRQSTSGTTEHKVPQTRVPRSGSQHTGPTPTESYVKMQLVLKPHPSPSLTSSGPVAEYRRADGKTEKRNTYRRRTAANTFKSPTDSFEPPKYPAPAGFAASNAPMRRRKSGTGPAASVNRAAFFSSTGSRPLGPNKLQGTASERQRTL